MKDKRFISVPSLNAIRYMPLYGDIRQLLDGAARDYADDIAFISKPKDGSGGYIERSYALFREEIDNLGTALLEMGCLGKRMAVIGRNRYEWLLGYYAQLCGLGICIPLDKDLPYEELELSLKRARADILVFGAEHLHLAEELKKLEAFRDMQLLSMDDIPGYTCLSQLLKRGEEAPRELRDQYKSLPIDGNALSLILFTSGTSGLSKAVMLSQYNITHNIWATLAAEDLRRGDVNMAFLPYHHTFGSTGQTMMLCAGMTTVYCDGLKYIQKNICEYKVSVFICVPLLIESIYKKIQAEIDKRGKRARFEKGLKISAFLRKLGIDIRRKLFKDIHNKLGGKLRYIISGASPLDPEVSKGFTALGIQVVQGYGLTECSPVLAAENTDNLKAGTIGKAIPEVELRIDNPNEEGVGEIIARGPNVMLGYYEDEAATGEMIRDGWLHTGDLGSVDRDGFLSISGRAKNVVVLKNGKNIYPEELEILVGNLPYVQECMVFGEAKNPEGDPKDLMLSVRVVYDPGRIEEIRGAVSTEDIKKAIRQDIEAINDKLPPYKRIYRRYVTDQPMEKTTTGKVKRYKQLHAVPEG